MDWHAQVGLVLLGLVILVIRYIPVQPSCKREKQHVPRTVKRVSTFSTKVPSPLAKRKQGQVNCTVATNHVPKYKRSQAMRIRAQELVAAVADGKRVIATHTEDVCSPGLRTTIAGVVRARKELKKLEYDQPF